MICVLFYVALLAINVALCFPYATDKQTANNRAQAAADFYKLAYAAPTAPSKEEQDQEEIYVRVATRAAKLFDIDGMVRRFAAEHDLQNKRVLDIGAGRGYLQDVVDNYVGLDISPTAQRFFHKPFVLASATAMPFKDDEFDAAWTIWVLEHVPNPESALEEMRRVVKPGGYILLAPAWSCNSWAAQGYQVRPYSDFGPAGKLTKASLPLRASPLFLQSYVLPIRILRYLSAVILPGPTSFHYRRLNPNYTKYWVPDSDAVNSMDVYEAVLWFESRGDRCVNCPGWLGNLGSGHRPLVIQVGAKHLSQASHAQSGAAASALSAITVIR
jgi:SAM-dependent methyltransferase